jgi:hypothetical protein
VTGCAPRTIDIRRIAPAHFLPRRLFDAVDPILSWFESGSIRRTNNESEREPSEARVSNDPRN